jgi:hypothetical protein
LRSPQETKRTAKFLGSPAKSSPWLGEQAPLALGCPARKRAHKRRDPHFTYKAHWFVLSQTEGPQCQPPTIPEWNEERALAALDLQRTPFEDLDGNTQGYARRGRKIAVSPIAALPVKNLFHEVGRVVLGHTGEGDLVDTEWTPHDIREMEAEGVSSLCCESLSLPGTEFSRCYVTVEFM